ncbi:MAG: SCO family protein [Wenzhouxiangellaceae bacterium]
MLVSVLVVATAAAWLYNGDGRAAAGGRNSAPESLRSVLWPEPLELAEFELTTQTGRAFTENSFAGQWDLVFFGYLDCPDICPMTLGAMRQMRRLLMARGFPPDAARFVLVSVDTEKDGPERMGRYLAEFDREFIGLTGTQAMVDRFAESLAVYYRKVPDSPGNAIDHTSSLMIIDPEGRAVGALQPPLVPERMVEVFGDLHTINPAYK